MKEIRTLIFGAGMCCALMFATSSVSAQVTLAPTQTASSWQVVVNNGVVVPGDVNSRQFNSYNQPSINVNQLVVFRGRSKAGNTGSGEPAHGIFLRDMSSRTAIKTLFDRNTAVPQPNNLTMPNSGSPVTFTEPPSFPRIDMWSATVASRGSHQPVWVYDTGLVDEETGEPITTRAGTTGIYTNPYGPLISGANNLGVVPEFDFFRVPEVTDRTVKFDVFPGAPAVADKNTIVFKGNYTLPDPTDPEKTISKTGVYYRTLSENPIGYAHLAPAGGEERVVLIANNSTMIPGTTTPFGSTAPPSAVGYVAVFAGFDDENAPTKGGIYLAQLNSAQQPPPLTPLVLIGSPVPTERNAFFNKIGEGLSFDGRFVAFWGAWGSDNKAMVLQCPTDGNKNIVAYCKSLYGDGSEEGDGFRTSVPVHQGIFVHDIVTHSTWAVAKTPNNYTDFVYWNFSGKVTPPQGGTGGDGGTGGEGTDVVLAEGEGSAGSGGMEGETDGEPARWRSASFVAVSGLVDGRLNNANVHAIFKARTGTVVNGAYANAKDGIYFRPGPDGPVKFTTLVESGMDGRIFDSQATYIPVDEFGNEGPVTPLPVTTMGIERDGFRGNTVVLNIGMGNEEAGWAGIYLTKITQ